MILVTGATGYIGSHMVYRLMELGHKVLMVDDFSNSDQSTADTLIKIATDNGWPTPVMVHLDLSDEELVYKLCNRFDFETVFHFAAWKSVPESMSKPLKYVHKNVTALNNLLMNLQHTVKFFIFSSSCSVYEQVETYTAYSEDMATGPASPYGMTKLMGEQILERAAQADENLTYVALRYFNPIGAHPSGLIGEQLVKGKNLMPMLGAAALGLVPALTIYGNDYKTKDGTAVRDYVDIMDLIEGHILAYEHLWNGGRSEIINLGTGNGCTVMDVARVYGEVSNTHSHIEWLPRRPGDMQSLVASYEKAKNLLGWEPKATLYESCLNDWAWRQASV